MTKNGEIEVHFLFQTGAFSTKMAKFRPTSYLKREHFRRKLAKSTPTSYFKREHFQRQLRESVQSRPTSSSKREQFLASISVDAAETDSFQRSRTVTHAFFKRATLDAYMRFLPPTPLSNVHFKKDDLFQEKRSTMFYHDTDFTTT